MIIKFKKEMTLFEFLTTIHGNAHDNTVFVKNPRMAAPEQQAKDTRHDGSPYIAEQTI